MGKATLPPPHLPWTPDGGPLDAPFEEAASHSSFTPGGKRLGLGGGRARDMGVDRVAPSPQGPLHFLQHQAGVFHPEYLSSLPGSPGT